MNGKAFKQFCFAIEKFDKKTLTSTFEKNCFDVFALFRTHFEVTSIIIGPDGSLCPSP